MKDRVQNLSYVLIIAVGLLMICGSLYLRVNYGKETVADQQTIRYSYPNISLRPELQHRFRKIDISFETLKQIIPKDTKDIRLLITRTMEGENTPLLSEHVFSIVLEGMANYKSIMFDYDRCIYEYEDCTDICVYMLMERADLITLRKMTITINRVTDKISVSGHEIDTDDIVDRDLSIAINELRN